MKTSDPVRVISGNVDLAMTSDGEAFITETEREFDVWSTFFGTFNANTYVILVSKDNPLFPHKIQGQDGNRIDVTSLYYGADLVNNTDAVVHLGVITRINGVSADIKYFFGLPLLTGGARAVVVDQLKGTPSQVKTDFNNSGVLQHGITNNVETNVVAVNTGITLASPAGNITPGLGDIILHYEHVSGTTDLGIFIFYHNND